MRDTKVETLSKMSSNIIRGGVPGQKLTGWKAKIAWKKVKAAEGSQLGLRAGISPETIKRNIMPHFRPEGNTVEEMREWANEGPGQGRQQPPWQKHHSLSTKPPGLAGRIKPVRRAKDSPETWKLKLLQHGRGRRVLREMKLESSQSLPSDGFGADWHVHGQGIEGPDDHIDPIADPIADPFPLTKREAKREAYKGEPGWIDPDYLDKQTHERMWPKKAWIPYAKRDSAFKLVIGDLGTQLGKGDVFMIKILRSLMTNKPARERTRRGLFPSEKTAGTWWARSDSEIQGLRECNIQVAELLACRTAVIGLERYNAAQTRRLRGEHSMNVHQILQKEVDYDKTMQNPQLKKKFLRKHAESTDRTMEAFMNQAPAQIYAENPEWARNTARLIQLLRQRGGALKDERLDLDFNMEIFKLLANMVFPSRKDANSTRHPLQATPQVLIQRARVRYLGAFELRVDERLDTIRRHIGHLENGIRNIITARQYRIKRMLHRRRGSADTARYSSKGQDASEDAASVT